MTIQPGTDIGRYHIIEKLGEGGMAVVYKAYDTRLDNEVAVKFIRTERLAPEFRERTIKRFQIEARKMANLQHTNIVKVTDFGEFEGAPYLVMPFLSGGTLKKMMGKPMRYDQAARLLTPIADALEYAHSKGLMHRDIKPSNILITEGGQPMLSDFGVAKMLENEMTQELTMTGMGVGTPEYMAPEQAEGKAVDQRADIYALGVVLYELITGRKPFVADTPLAVLIKQVRDPLPRPSSYVSGLPAQVEHILIKALAKDPKERYAHAPEMLRQLSQAGGQVGQKEPAARQSSETVQTTDTVKSESQPKKSGLAGVLLVGAAAVALGVYFIFLRPEPQATAMATTPEEPENPVVEASPTASCGLLNGTVQTASGVTCSERDAACMVHFRQEGGFPEGEILLVSDRPRSVGEVQQETWTGQVRYDNGEMLVLHACRRDDQANSLICGGMDEQGAYRGAETAEIALCREGCCLPAGQERVMVQAELDFFLTAASCCEDIRSENVAYYRYPTDSGPLYLGFDLVCDEGWGFGEECAEFEAYVGANQEIFWVGGYCCTDDEDAKRIKCEGRADDQKDSLTKVNLKFQECEWETEFRSPFTPPTEGFTPRNTRMCCSQWGYCFVIKANQSCRYD